MVKTTRISRWKTKIYLIEADRETRKKNSKTIIQKFLNFSFKTLTWIDSSQMNFCDMSEIWGKVWWHSNPNRIDFCSLCIINPSKVTSRKSTNPIFQCPETKLLKTTNLWPLKTFDYWAGSQEKFRNETNLSKYFIEDVPHFLRSCDFKICTVIFNSFFVYLRWRCIFEIENISYNDPVRFQLIIRVVPMIHVQKNHLSPFKLIFAHWTSKIVINCFMNLRQLTAWDCSRFSCFCFCSASFDEEIEQDCALLLNWK